MNAPLIVNEKSVINHAVAYTDEEWDKLDPDLQSELETQYVLSNPILMAQINSPDNWFTITPEQVVLI